MALFQVHFLVMNALYRLRQERYPELIISALEIALYQTKEPSNSENSLSDPGYANLASYYLDWSNFKGATKASVEELLNDFWECYLAMDDRVWALDLFGLQEPLTASDIKRRYRQKAMKLHPDRGGDHHQLVELNKARDILNKIYS